MTPYRWTDEFLDGLRKESDLHADEAFRLILEDNEATAIQSLFRNLDSNDAIPVSKTFPVLADFFEVTGNLPSDVQLERVHRGEDVFRKNAFSAALALLTKSLPEGYQAPNLSMILNISGELERQTYKRLLATLQTVVNVSTCHGFQKGGRAVITAQKLRLLHAGVRHLTRKHLPEYEKKHSVPVNQEDLLGTALGFSLLVIEGWRRMNIPVTHDEEEDFLYLWLVFAQMMGIHPVGEHASHAYLPDNVDDASAFYRAYERRHYVDGSKNPDGVALAQANLQMLKRKIPFLIRILGFGVIPRLSMNDLMGDEACSRLRIPPVRGHPLIKGAIVLVHKLYTMFENPELQDHERLGMILFQDLINRSYGGDVTFTVPIDLEQLRTMVHIS